MLRPAIALTSLLVAVYSPASAIAAGPDKQLLLISFDGAGDNRLWVKSRAMAARAGAHFTYFLSCTNLIDRKMADGYKAPGKKSGRSNVGFAPSAEDVSVRLDHVWQAHLEGHEIGSHGCGHFDGKDWSKADWLQEMASFREVMADAWKNIGKGGSQPDGWQDFAAGGVTGFRAPYLSASATLPAAEKAAGFAYDASLVARETDYPEKDGGLVRFGLPLIPEGPKQRRIIAMDYNLFVRHSMGVDNPSQSAAFEERAYKAFRSAFDEQYSGARKPLQIGFHFTEMNGGAYWRALERLVDDVCHRADVACVTYAEAMKLIDHDLMTAANERPSQ